MGGLITFGLGFLTFPTLWIGAELALDLISAWRGR